MSTISKGPDGIVLLCHNCSHVEGIDLFDETLGNRRTQAAQTRRSRSGLEHDAGSVPQPIPKADALGAHRQ
jgi:hypothetical protein